MCDRGFVDFVGCGVLVRGLVVDVVAFDHGALGMEQGVVLFGAVTGAELDVGVFGKMLETLHEQDPLFGKVLTNSRCRRG